MCFVFFCLLGNKFACDLLKCDQSDESTLNIGKSVKLGIDLVKFNYLRF